MTSGRRFFLLGGALGSREEGMDHPQVANRSMVWSASWPVPTFVRIAKGRRADYLSAAQPQETNMGWFGDRKTRTPRQVIIYTRQGCHLCDEAWQLLEEWQGKYQFTLEAIDIDGQAELVAEYGERVPVVLIDGKERFWGRINGVLLERALRSR
jgi:glutaredoxin